MPHWTKTKLNVYARSQQCSHVANVYVYKPAPSNTRSLPTEILGIFSVVESADILSVFYPHKQFVKQFRCDCTKKIGTKKPGKKTAKCDQEHHVHPAGNCFQHLALEESNSRIKVI